MITFELNTPSTEPGDPEVVELKVELVVDSMGVLLRANQYSVLRITSEGFLQLIESVGESTGLQLDDRGRILQKVKTLYPGCNPYK